MNTTLSEIRKHNPCVEGWTKLLKHLGKTAADDEPLPILTIMDSNGLDDALWCLRAVTGHDREIRLYAVWCARQVQNLMPDERSITVLQVAEDFANGVATAKQLDAAAAAARAAVWAAVWDSTWDSARDVAWAAARAAAWDAAWDAVWAAQAEKLKEICKSVEAAT